MDSFLLCLYTQLFVRDRRHHHPHASATPGFFGLNFITNFGFPITIIMQLPPKNKPNRRTTKPPTTRIYHSALEALSAAAAGAVAGSCSSASPASVGRTMELMTGSWGKLTPRDG